MQHKVYLCLYIVFSLFLEHFADALGISPFLLAVEMRLNGFLSISLFGRLQSWKAFCMSKFMNPFNIVYA